MSILNSSTFKSSKGRLKLFVNGFIYNKNRQVNNTVYWICELYQTKQCKSRATTIVNMETETHTVTKHNDYLHNHDPDPARPEISSIITELKINSIEHPEKKTCQILQAAKRNADEMILSKLPSTSAMRQIVYREKSKGKPVFMEPTSVYFTIHHDGLQIHEENFVICDEIFNENKRIIIFSCRKMMEFFGKSTLLIMDGTFKIASNNFLQLYVIHGNIHKENKNTFPLLFALCTHKDKVTYNKMFDLIISYCHERDIIINAKNVIMDFELAAMQSVKQNFDNVQINGCFFHLAQIIYRKIQKTGKATMYGTNVNFAIEMKCLLALAFLNNSKITQYFEKFLETVSPDSLEIVTMFGHNFVIDDAKKPKFPPHLWSISELQKKGLPRTQNSAESWHHRINQLIDVKNPGFYKLAHELLKESFVILGNIEKMLNGETPPKKKKRNGNANKNIDNILKNIDEYTECQFLRSIASNLNLKRNF